jgi:hypothetical protein
MTRTTRLLLATACAAAGALAPAGAALAAPDHSFTLSADQPTASWAGKLGTGFVEFSDQPRLPQCGTAIVRDCDYTLLHVIGAGTINLTTTAGGDAKIVDTALNTYDSDSTGTKGDNTGHADQSAPSAEESLSVDTLPDATDSWVLVELDYLLVAGGSPQVSATFTPLG